MNIFFTGSVRGGRSHQPEYAAIIETLEHYGTVFSSHVSDDALSSFGETSITAREVLAREQVALAKCDVIVAEVSTPSLGVGYLIAYASALEKKIVALYRGDDALKLSAIIKGDAKVETHAYKSEKDIERILADIFSK